MLDDDAPSARGDRGTRGSARSGGAQEPARRSGAQVPARPRPLDAADHAILTALSRDGRQSVTAIAEQLHLSRANTYDRIAKLRASGVLQGYTAVIDPRAAGLETAAYVFVTLKQDDWEVLRRALAEEPAVRHLALVGGQYDAVLLVRTRTVEELRRVIFERIQSLNCVQATQTALIFDDHAQHVHLGLDAADS